MMKGLFLKSNQFVIKSTLVIYLLAIVLYFIWWKKYDTIVVEAMVYGFLLLPILALGALRSATLRGLRFIVLAELPDTLLRNLWFTLLISIAIFIEYPLTPKGVVIFQIIAASISFVLGLVFFNKKLWSTLSTIPSKFNTKEWVSQTIPFSINGGVQVVRSKLLNYILVAFGSVEAVALFDVALRGANLVAFTLNALNNAISPYISAAYEKGDFKLLQRIIKKTGRIIFLFSLPVALTFIIGGNTLVQFVFGKEYGASYIPLVILCLGQLLSSMVGSVGLLLNMTGNQKVFSKSNLQMLLLHLLLSIPLVVYLDVMGAAIIFSGLLILQNIILLRYVRRKLHINTAII